MKLCVVIPALNEEATIADVIRRVPCDIPGVDETVVVLVDDGSTDRTCELAEACGAWIVRHPRNRGVVAPFPGTAQIKMELQDCQTKMCGSV